jgi:hypothetical protein
MTKVNDEAEKMFQFSKKIIKLKIFGDTQLKEEKGK